MLLSGARYAGLAPRYAPYREAACDQCTSNQDQEGPTPAGIGQALGHRSGKVLLDGATGIAHLGRKGVGQEAAHEVPPAIDGLARRTYTTARASTTTGSSGSAATAATTGATTGVTTTGVTTTAGVTTTGAAIG